jgi:hypothetical protein
VVTGVPKISKSAYKPRAKASQWQCFDSNFSDLVRAFISLLFGAILMYHSSNLMGSESHVVNFCTGTTILRLFQIPDSELQVFLYRMKFMPGEIAQT